jgi:hypothetical protein
MEMIKPIDVDFENLKSNVFDNDVNDDDCKKDGGLLFAGCPSCLALEMSTYEARVINLKRIVEEMFKELDKMDVDNRKISYEFSRSDLSYWQEQFLEVARKI